MNEEKKRGIPFFRQKPFGCQLNRNSYFKPIFYLGEQFEGMKTYDSQL